MGWIHQEPDKAPAHSCNAGLPKDTWNDPVGNLGSVWRCDDCGELWEIARGPYGVPLWRTIKWRTRRRLKELGKIPS
jgi:hypothetical protein